MTVTEVKLTLHRDNLGRWARKPRPSPLEVFYRQILGMTA